VQPLTPGTYVDEAIALNPLAYTLRTGDRIRITISAPGGDRPSWSFTTLETKGQVTDTIQFGSVGVSTLFVNALQQPAMVTPTDSRPACGTNRGMPCRTYIAAGNGG
jgi:predicted acyl esterase